MNKYKSIMQVTMEFTRLKSLLKSVNSCEKLSLKTFLPQNHHKHIANVGATIMNAAHTRVTQLLPGLTIMSDRKERKKLINR